MQLTRLLLSIAAASGVAWAQDAEPKGNSDLQGIPVGKRRGDTAETDWLTPHATQLRTHSLTAPFLDSDMQSRWWDFGGSTLIRTDQYVRLTADRASQSGWIFSRVPLTATNWEIEFEFKVKGKGNLYGDGFAMWLTKQRAQSGDVFGFVDKFEGLGIFFDTYKNNRPGVTFPYVMAMMGDGQTSYEKGTDGKNNELAGCSARGIRNKDIPTKAKLTYFQDQNLVLQLQYKKEDEWIPCFDIPNIKIPTVSYLGFSAETGELSDNHDIISVQTKNLYDAATRGQSRKAAEQKRKDRASSKKPSSPYSEGSSSGIGGWIWFLVKVIIGSGVVGAAGYFGYTAYRTRQRTQARKYNPF